MAHLSEAKLFNANLSDAVLRGAKLRRAELYRADLRGVDLRGADLRGAKLSVANLRRAQLNNADLRTALLRWCDLRGAVLGEAKLDKADLTGANLIWSDLYGAQLNETILSKADFRWARFGDTSVTCALDETKGLNEATHWGPSYISTQTLLGFKGQIPEVFLRGCGLTDREIENARLCDPDVTASEIVQMQTELPRRSRHAGRFIGGIFICYCQKGPLENLGSLRSIGHGATENAFVLRKPEVFQGPQKDVAFVDKLEKPLQEAGVAVWRDEHRQTDDPIQHCAIDAARPTDLVLLVMSQSTIHGDWVEALMNRQHEKEQQQRKSRQEDAAALIPIVLDDAWKVTAENSNSTIKWNKSSEHHFNFSHWQDDQVFTVTFQELLSGLNFDTKPADSDQEPIP